MTCVSPPELAPIALLAYLDGEAEPETAMHMEQCAYCRQRANEYAEESRRLSERLFRVACPSALQLGEFYLDLLPPTERVAVAQHLVLCPHCSQELADLSTFMGQPDPVKEAGPAERLAERVRVLVAQLVSGPAGSGIFGAPLPSPGLARVRGNADQPLIYHADDLQVVIELQDDAQEAGRSTVLGLIIGAAEPQTMAANLWQDGRPIARVPVDALGNFMVEKLAAGRYELILSGPDIEIHIQDFQVMAV